MRNKLRRRAVHVELKKTRSKEQREERKRRKREREELGDQAPPPKPQRTIENTREQDETVVHSDDEEVAADEAMDELSGYDTGVVPKVLVTTSFKPVGETYKFAEAFINIVPGAEFHQRRDFPIKTIIEEAIGQGYTAVVVVNENRKRCTGLVVSHLPAGPTAHFKLSSIKHAKEIEGHGRATMHYPEVILNNFHTRLGHQVGRMLRALFHPKPEFSGRACVTFHNQRDFIFFRRHRYIFKDSKKVGLQELGPRFTLKLRALQKGTFDSAHGEYEWMHTRKEMDTSRRRFHL